ncbi:MAG: hypothetical protein LBT56_07965, partial [Prevotellaceae bacterium]|nr:hypothetical protein [Prevotellaceae bacterium]
AKSYMEYYKNQPDVLQSATIAVVDTQPLEAFARALQQTALLNADTALGNKTGIQKYDRLPQPVFYDLQNYMERAVAVENDLVALKQQLSKIVVYHDFTPYFLNEFPITESCGMSVYISSGDDRLDAQYKLLDWYRDTQSGD